MRDASNVAVLGDVPWALAPAAAIFVVVLAVNLVVQGPGSTAGSALAGHPDVDSMTFTGSTETGKQIMQLAARHVTPVTLELGGKNPQIVFPDAKLDKALKGVLFGAFQQEAKFDRVFSNSFFWVVTRSNDCFY